MNSEQGEMPSSTSWCPSCQWSQEEREGRGGRERREGGRALQAARP